MENPSLDDFEALLCACEPCQLSRESQGCPGFRIYYSGIYQRKIKYCEWLELDSSQIKRQAWGACQIFPSWWGGVIGLIAFAFHLYSLDYGS